MSDGPVILLRDLSQPESTERSCNLLFEDRKWAEIELRDAGAPIRDGTPVGLQTSQSVYLGHVHSGEMSGDCQRLRVRVDHWLAVQDVSTMQKLWSQEQPD